MADIKTFFVDITKGADYVLENFLLQEDDGLATAVILSWFTDARAAESDALPGGGDDRRGWWGSEYAAVPGDPEGSLLWLFMPSKQLQSTMVEIQEAASTALAWMVRDRIAGRVDVVATNPRDGVLSLRASIYKPNGELEARYEVLWSGHAA